MHFFPVGQVAVDYAYDHSGMDFGTHYYQAMDSWDTKQPVGDPNFASVPYSDKRMESFTPSEKFKESNFSIDGHSLIIDYAFSDAFNIKSLTAYRELDESFYQDYSANPNVPRLFMNDPFITKQDQFSQELQFTGALDRYTYIAGLYYFKEHGKETATDYLSLQFPPFVPFGAYQLQSRQTKAVNEAVAVYGQLTYTPPVLEDRLAITAGLRYTEDDRSVDVTRTQAFDGVTFANVKASNKWDNLSGTLIASYEIADNQSAYLKFSQGYRTGGFNGRGTRPDAVQLQIDEETVEAYELGYKSEWFERRLRSNIAFYQMDYKDLQLSFATQGDPADVRFFNAGNAEMKGVELDVTAVPLDGLLISLQYAYLDSEIKGVTNPYTGQPDPHKYALPSAPEQTYAVDVEYTLAPLAIGILIANINYSWRDRVVTSADNAPGAYIDRYNLLNTRLALTEILVSIEGELKLTLRGKNLADKEYLVDSVGAFSWAEQTGAFGQPRSYGIDITYEF
ncbi:MAG: TonB-dependent receptor [Spongiibacteraceae bacterium]|nr:TonB-dependent receptor [Spongiibacteraceae bacterium]